MRENMTQNQENERLFSSCESFQRHVRSMDSECNVDRWPRVRKEKRQQINQKKSNKQKVGINKQKSKNVKQASETGNDKNRQTPSSVVSWKKEEIQFHAAGKLWKKETSKDLIAYVWEDRQVTYALIWKEENERREEIQSFIDAMHIRVIPLYQNILNTSEIHSEIFITVLTSERRNKKRENGMWCWGICIFQRWQDYKRYCISLANSKTVWSYDLMKTLWKCLPSLSLCVRMFAIFFLSMNIIQSHTAGCLCSNGIACDSHSTVVFSFAVWS